MQTAKSINRPTIGILYCGDMGSALAKLLKASSLRVVTTCQGRSRKTGEQAQSAGIEILPTLDDVVAESQFVFSLVLPSAAVDMAQQYAERHRLRPHESVFVDANSIGVQTLIEIDAILAQHDIPLVDATLHGGAHRFQEVGVMYISGPPANRVQSICRDSLRICNLGNDCGSAKRMKQLLAGISKGLNALFLEVAVLAQQSGMLPKFLENCRRFYPGLMTAIERMLPTYPRHASRRVGELKGIISLAQSNRSKLGMLREASQLIGLMAEIDWGESEITDIQNIVETVSNSLSGESPSVFPGEVVKAVADCSVSGDPAPRRMLSLSKRSTSSVTELSNG